MITRIRRKSDPATTFVHHTNFQMCSSHTLLQSSFNKTATNHAKNAQLHHQDGLRWRINALHKAITSVATGSFRSFTDFALFSRSRNSRVSSSKSPREQKEQCASESLHLSCSCFRNRPVHAESTARSPETRA